MIDQNEERQIQAMEKEEVTKYFKENASAKDTNRPKLLEMIEFARKGDVIIIKDFSCVARSTQDLLNIVSKLDAKGIKLRSLKENLDTNTSTGKLMLTMIGEIYEFERENMLERQREGIAKAKKNGMYKGRKEVQRPSNWDEIYTKWKNREITATKAIELSGLKRNTFYRMLNESNKV